MSKKRNKKGPARKNEFSRSGGFTLIEIIVSLGLFTVVVTIVVSSLLYLVDMNRKAQSLETVMDNLSLAIDSMSRNIRVGTSYHCGSTGDITSPRNCSSGSSYFAFESSDGDKDNPNDQIVYQFSENQIQRSIDGGSNFVSITAPEILIESDGLKFFVFGTEVSDSKQPKVIILVKGEAGTKENLKSSFSVQTTISQRSTDG